MKGFKEMASKKLNLLAVIITALGLSNLFGCSNIDNTTPEIINTTSDLPDETKTITDQELTVTITDQATESNHIKDPDSPILESGLKFQGRHLYKNDIQWLVQSGSSAEFTVTGTNVSILLTNISSINNYISSRPRYAVFLDDKLIRDKIITAPEENIILFEEAYQRTANVKIILLSEAVYGAIGIKNINVIGGDANLITPLPDNKITIEFIGDSITCGYGVDDNNGDEYFSTETENFSKSYAYIAAKELNADYSVVAYSGYGVVSGYSSGEKNFEETVPKYYNIASNHSDYNEKWNFSEHNTDAVFINLGTNDIEYVNSENKDAKNEFIKEYAAFLKNVRKANPNASIICTVGLMGGGESIYPLIQKAVEKFNDDKTTCFLSNEMDIDKNGAGAGWHPSAKTQKEYGLIVAEEIRKAIDE